MNWPLFTINLFNSLILARTVRIESNQMMRLFRQSTSINNLIRKVKGIILLSIANQFDIFLVLGDAK
ncbi:hypothetical protein BLOT_008435 [Blomia tropicalis]|nr:hypothetical protein BLOT_008435 [Blomia tropicalis]